MLTSPSVKTLISTNTGKKIVGGNGSNGSYTLLSRKQITTVSKRWRVRKIVFIKCSGCSFLSVKYKSLYKTEAPYESTSKSILLLHKAPFFLQVIFSPERFYHERMTFSPVAEPTWRHLQETEPTWRHLQETEPTWRHM